MEIKTAELGELQALMKEELKDLYSARELDSIVKGLFSHVTGLSAAQMVIEKEQQLDEAKIFYLQRALKRLRAHEPLQYITGIAHFHGLDFEVDSRVLIPRPETEELVQWVLTSAGHEKALRILDIGTGSGCIAITIKNELPESVVHAIDISDGALALAKENASTVGVDIIFDQINILDEESRAALEKFDVIISNPPYVTPEDRKLMQKNVVDHEPGLALFVESDPLIFYKAIIDFSKEHLQDQGKLFFECNEKYTNEIVELLGKENYTDIEERKDMQEKWRMVLGVRC